MVLIQRQTETITFPIEGSEEKIEIKVYKKLTIGETLDIQESKYSQEKKGVLSMLKFIADWNIEEKNEKDEIVKAEINEANLVKYIDSDIFTKIAEVVANSDPKMKKAMDEKKKELLEI